MKNLLPLFLLLCSLPAHATPIRWQDAAGAQTAMQNVVIERGNLLDGSPTIHAKWQINYGFIASWCSITLASEFLDVMGPRTLWDAFKAPTHRQQMWLWRRSRRVMPMTAEN